MQRRKFVIGLGATASGGAAALGTGAFSRVEAQRQVTIQVANDANAYLGLVPIDTPNSNNYVSTDGNGHLAIDIGEIPDGENEIGGSGVNSDSFTWFDGMFRLCNQGKADATISYQFPESPSHPSLGNNWTAPADGYDQQVVALYYIDGDGERVILNEGDELTLSPGECAEIGVRTVTKGIDATTGDPLIDGEITVTADAPGAGESSGSGGGGGGGGN